MHFSIVKMNPKDAQPSHGFDDVIFPLYYALAALGFEVEILFNKVNPKSRNIILGSCIAPRRINRMLPPGSIIFNLEQMGIEGSLWCNENYMTHLRSFTVWDYSEANLPHLAAAGVKDLVHVPLGYVPQMTRLNPAWQPPQGQDVDALFYGCMGERRHQLIQRFLGAGVHTLVSQAAFGNLRDRLLAHSRLVLNIHFYLPARLEVVRLGYVWANKKAVLSERRADTHIPDYLGDACTYAAYDDMPDAALSLLSDPARLANQAEQGFKAFSSRPLAESLSKIIGKRVHTFKPPELPEQDAEHYLRPVHNWLIDG